MNNLDNGKKFLKFINQQTSKFASLIKCYEHLELWEEIRNKTEILAKMKKKKNKNAHFGLLENVQFYMQFFPEESDLNIMFLIRCF